MIRNNLTANDKYPVRDCESLSSPIQMELSLKSKPFSDFFVPFLESTSNFKHFEKEHDLHSCFISEITECETPDFENISLSYMLKSTGFSNYIDCNWQVSCSGLWQFLIPDPNAIFFETKTFSNSYVLFPKSTSNFKNFGEQYDLHSYFISEITDCEKSG